MLVTAVEANPSRSLVDARIELGSGVASLIGPNGAGKTNLLEALYFALTGRSFRTSDRRDLIPFGGQLARAEAVVRDDDGIEHRLLASVSRAEGRRHLLDGSPVDAATAARHRPPVAVFSPDRLALIKGPPAERRAHVDRFLAARWPSRAGLRVRFGQALAQRNALLARAPGRRRASSRPGTPHSPRPRRPWSKPGPRRWRTSPRGSLRPPPSSGWRAPRRSSTPRGRPARPRRSARGSPSAARPTLRLGRSSWGPHLDEVKIAAADRALRRFGSQGQQRTALLALLFAERSALAEARRVTPLLLLDDVMSELDPERRERLVELLAGAGPGRDHRRDRGVGAGPAARRRDPDAARAARLRRGRGGMTHRSAPRPAAEGAASGPRAGGAEDPPRGRPGGLGGDRRASGSPRSLEPVSEADGTVTVACSDPVWADELDLMQEQLLAAPHETAWGSSPRRVCGSVRIAHDLNYILSVFCRLFIPEHRFFRGPELVSLCQLAFRPRSSVSITPSGRGFSEIREDQLPEI